MKREFNVRPLVVILILLRLAFGDDKKLAQTGFQFLSVASDARAAALAGAVTTMRMGSSSLFFNPAGIAELPTSLEFSASQNNWIADINYKAFSLALNPFNSRYGVIGISVLSVDYGQFQGTMVWGNDQGYIDTEVFEPSAVMIGIGYAKALSSMFSVGGQLKYAGQNLGDSIIEVGDSLKVKKYKAYATAFDFGTLFKTGFRSVTFGISVRNFSNEIKYENEGFQLPLTFKMGISMDLFNILPRNRFSDALYVSIDAAHPRSYPEYINLGVEYKLLNTLYLRYGYLQNRDERASNLGFGIEKLGFVFDYSYTPFGVFSYVQRFTLRFSI